MTQTVRNNFALAGLAGAKLSGITATCLVFAGYRLPSAIVGALAFVLVGAAIYLSIVNLRIQAAEEWKPEK